MSKLQAHHPQIPTPSKPASRGRVFKASLRGVPAVNAKMWAELKEAARKPASGRRYAEIAEAPDA